MRVLGKVVGRSRSGRWLVRAVEVPSLRAAVVDKDLVLLGQVVDVFGPAASPFVSLASREPSAQVSPGDQVYLLTRKDRRLRRWRTPTT